MTIFFRIMIYLMFFTAVPSYKSYRLNVEEALQQRQEMESWMEQEAQPVNECSCSIEEKGRPEVKRVVLRDESESNLLRTARITNVYQREIMSSGVVGLVGVPVRVSYDEQVDSPLLTFYYDAEELRGIPERNLIILHENENGFYGQVGEETLDQREKTVSVRIPEPGVYLLADRYTWYDVWGVDVSEFAYEVDPTAYPSDWERECDTGSIMELVDKEWVMENAPYFHVSTPEQLAGVVYYVNALSVNSQTGAFLYLEDDIDLAGYDWVPMGWLGPQNSGYMGEVDGQGHAILNMNIPISYGDHCAFIAYSTGSYVHDVSFRNASVSGDGHYAGIVGGEIYISHLWENIHVDGVISNARGEIGSIIGREAHLYFKDCTADVVLRDAYGNETPVEYFSHRQEVLANTPATEDFTLTLNADGSVTRTTSDESFRNLCWHLELDGVEVLQRLAEKETTFDPGWAFANATEDSQCLIWLEAFTGETYTRVSNVLEYR